MNILDLPIYRASQKKHANDIGKKVKKHLNELEKNPYWKAEFIDFPEKKSKRAIEEASNYLPWEFNQTIGFLRLRFWKTQIRATLYQMDKKNYHINFKNEKFKIVDSEILISGLNILPSSTSDEIYQETLDGLKEYTKKLSPRFLDLSQFQTVWKHMNWKALYDFHRKQEGQCNF